MSLLSRILAALAAAACLAGCLADAFIPKNPRRLFVTSTLHTGNLGGLAGADSICEARAAEAGLGGRWSAFLSDSSQAAMDRGAESDAWLLVSRRELVFRNNSGFLLPAKASITDERGNAVPGGWAWTGTLVDGSPDTADHCDRWTNGGQDRFGAVGDPVRMVPDDSPRWMHVPGALRCSSPARLYCMEQDPPTPP